MDMAEVLKQRRAELGISQTTLGEMAGVNVRQIARYESAEQQPVLNVAVRLAEALQISLAELAGQITHGLELGGEWHAGWQIWRKGDERIDIQEVQAIQHGQHLQLTADRTHPVDQGGYAWVGELRIWDNEVLMGWYRGADGAVRSKGVFYFVLHPQGTEATGRWTGMSMDGNILTGHAALSRNPETTQTIMQTLTNQNHQQEQP
jgi:transcriptional regulator with XRE-family HTH domain